LGDAVRFQHAAEIWRDFPELAAGAVYAERPQPLSAMSDPTELADRVASWTRAAEKRLADGSESAFVEIQAWRRSFSRMGLKPTQYRCAAESLLRRLRIDGSLPSINPVIDTCNAISVAYGIPVAVFDVDCVSEAIDVRYATGNETFESFGGTIEQPEPGEVVFADRAGRAHARRWTHRQAGSSSVGPNTSAALFVAEAMHDSGADDVRHLIEAVVEGLDHLGFTAVEPALLTAAVPAYDFRGAEATF
jgi:DNA/RNA-binding domain of Phe-tRNA-synthetase-like protein